MQWARAERVAAILLVSHTHTGWRRSSLIRGGDEKRGRRRNGLSTLESILLAVRKFTLHAFLPAGNFGKAINY